MKYYVQHLWLTVSLILLASAILLFSDFDRRIDSSLSDDQAPQIAIFKYNSTPLLDQHVNGIIKSLEKRNHILKDETNLKVFNAQGDITVANAIAKEMVEGPYDYLISSSTVALQVVANANDKVKKIHIFGAVTDPYGAGVGITGTEKGQHPDYLVGIGSFQPVERAFKIAKLLNPKLKKVGVLWNVAEKCSEACTFKARKICEELGIELIEINVSSSNEISEALKTILSEGVEAIWIGGDTTINAAVPIIVKIASLEGIPVFTNEPSDVEKNALFGIGADYFQVGEYTGNMAADIIEGSSPKDFKIENKLPEKLRLNKDVLVSLKNWQMVPEVEEQIWQEDEIPQIAKPGDGTVYKIALVNLIHAPSLDVAEKGFKDGLNESGLIENEHFKIDYFNAQGEISALSQIYETAIQQNPDVIASITSPALVAGANKVKEIPYVFFIASKPEDLGLFKNGVPSNITGVYETSTTKQLVELAVKDNSSLEKIGIIYDAAQPQSVLEANNVREACAERNLEILEATPTSVSEIPMAINSIIERGSDAFVLSADNLVATSYSTVYKIASNSGIPIYVADVNEFEIGAKACIGTNYYDWGKQASKQVVKILAGTSPSDIKIESSKTVKLFSNEKNEIKNKLFEISLVMYNETEFAENCAEGLLKGLENKGLEKNRDYKLRVLNAQGDMSTLSSIMNSVNSDQPDLLMVISTPCLQAALRQIDKEINIVFTGVGDGVRAGAGNSETDHQANVTGITTKSPFDGMARTISETLPNAKRVGTLFTPAEINSELYRGWFEDALAKYNIELVAVPVTSSSETAQATVSLCGEEIDAVAQIVDNTTRPGFAQIARKAADNNLPVYVFDSSQLEDGATICLARDYFDAGVEASEKAYRVLMGESPSDIPFSNTKSEKFIINLNNTNKYHLNISDDILKNAKIYKEH